MYIKPRLHSKFIHIDICNHQNL